MNRNLIVEPEAQSDLQAAFEWYQEQVPGLGYEFIVSVRACFARIERTPEIYTEIISEIRRARIERFPFGVFYVITEINTHVIGVFHSKRNPEHWLKRVRFWGDS